MRSVKGYLTALVTAVILPALLFGWASAWWIARALQEDVEQDARSIAQDVAADVSEYVQMTATALRVLARSPSVEEGDYERTYKFAAELARDLHQHVGVARPDGSQIFNTRRPYGTELPRRADPSSYTRALQTGQPSASDVIIGAIAQSPLITIDVPAVGPSGPMVLGSSTDVDVLADVVGRTDLPRGWTAGLLDGRGRFIAVRPGRSGLTGRSAPAGVAGALAARRFSAPIEYRTPDDGAMTGLLLPVSGTSWCVLVGFSDAATRARVQVPLLLLAAGWISAAGLGILFAVIGRRRLNKAVRLLRDSAAALGRGEQLPVGKAFLSDFELVVGAMRDAAVQIHDNEGRLRGLADDLERARRFAEKASRSKSEFLASMSHELRTPLNAIIGFADAMRGEVYGAHSCPKYAEYVEDIYQSGQYLLSLINDILDLSAIEAGKLELHEETFELEEALDSCLRLIAPRAQQYGITVIKAVPALPQVCADRRRIAQIVLNLLSNAVKFSPRSGTVTLAVRTEPSGALAVTVSDTGIGMDAAGIAKALQPFGQVDTALQRFREGTGLGLPLSKSLIELHGGTLCIVSVPGKGTAVTMVLPANRVQARADV